MLADKPSSAILAVSDIARARRFYEGTLGLQPIDGGDGGDVVAYATGTTQLIVYRSDEAGTNRANAAVFDAGDDIEAIVADLSRKGVRFEEYPIDGAHYHGGIHHAGAMKLVWFKDPDGNILHINAMPD